MLSRDSDSEIYQKEFKSEKKARSEKRKQFEMFENEQKISKFLNKNKRKLTRNNADSRQKTRTFMAHGHHKSSHNIENPINGSKFPYNSKFMDLSKKRHRKDMKSGGNIQTNNFKFMNVNWLNQQNTEFIPPFYANQMSSRGVQNQNIPRYQNIKNLNIMKI